jgi:hypothetical protein
MTHRKPDETAPRRPKAPHPKPDALTEDPSLVRDPREVLLRFWPLF